MRPYKAIIFDFDNTLFDSTSWLVAYTKSFLKTTQYNTWSYRDFYVLLNTPTGTNPAIAQEVSSRYWAGVKNLASSSVTPFPEVKAVVETLTTMGIKLGICSRSTTEKVDQLLRTYQLQVYFQCVLGSVDKQNSEALLNALTQLAVQPSTTLYVGDEAEDIEFGHGVGVATLYLVRNQDHFQETALLQKAAVAKLNPEFRGTTLADVISIITTSE